MVPARNRMVRSTDFSTVVRSGSRARGGTVVVHRRADLSDDREAAPLVGLVVSKAVGGSVVRHRVSRRLRAQLAARLSELPQASGTVVRALPEAAHATSAVLGADLTRALQRLSKRS